MSVPVAPGLGLTWAFAMEIIIHALDDGTPSGKQMARNELRDLAKRLDALNEGK